MRILTAILAQLAWACAASAQTADAPPARATSFGILEEVVGSDISSCYKGSCMPMVVRWVVPQQELILAQQGFKQRFVLEEGALWYRWTGTDKRYPVFTLPDGKLMVDFGKNGSNIWRRKGSGFSVQQIKRTKEGEKPGTSADYLKLVSHGEWFGQALAELSKKYGQGAAQAAPVALAAASAPVVPTKIVPEMKYPTTPEEIRAAWGPLAELAGHAWSEGTVYSWVQPGKLFIGKPLFQVPGTNATTEFRLAGYGRIAWTYQDKSNGAGGWYQLQPDGRSYLTADGRTFEYTVEGENFIRREPATGASSSSSMLSSESAASVASEMGQKWVRSQQLMAEQQRRYAEEQRRRDEEWAQMEEDEAYEAEEEMAEAQSRASQPNAYTILRGLADAATVNAQNAEANLQNTIARAQAQARREEAEQARQERAQQASAQRQADAAAADNQRRIAEARDRADAQRIAQERTAQDAARAVASASVANRPASASPPKDANCRVFQEASNSGIFATSGEAEAAARRGVPANGRVLGAATVDFVNFAIGERGRTDYRAGVRGYKASLAYEREICLGNAASARSE